MFKQNSHIAFALPFWSVFLLHNNLLLGVDAGPLYSYVLGSFFLTTIQLIHSFKNNSSGYFSFSKTDLALLIFALIWMGSYLLYFPPLGDFKFTYFLASLLYYFVFRQSGSALFKNPGFLLLAIVIPCLLQSVLAIAQFITITRLHHAGSIAGTLYNSNPLAMYLSVGLITAIAIYKNKWGYKLFVQITIFVSIIVLLLSNARTAWLGVAASLLLFLWEDIRKMVADWSNRINRTVLYGFVVLIGIPGVLFLWYYKPYSALGRAYIWEISLRAIFDKPFFGWGSEQFAVVYNYYQQLYFIKNPDSPFSFLANDRGMAFNEWIRIALENGVTGLAFFVIAIGSASVSSWRNKSFSTDITLMIFICLITECFFSYPLNIPSIRLLFISSLAALSSLSSPVISIRVPAYRTKIQYGFILIGTVALLSVHAKQYVIYLEWKKNIDHRQSKADQKLIQYQKFYPELKGYTNYLYNYADELSKHGEYAKSNVILNQVITKMNTVDIHMRRGDNNYNLGLYEKARGDFMYVKNLMPIKLTPRHWLVKTNNAMGHVDDACQETEKLLTMTVKVPSFEAEEILEEAEQYRISHCDSLTTEHIEK